MERYRLKNIIILILLLVNVFLLGSLFYRVTSQQDAWLRTTEQLVELLAADGIALDADSIPHTVPPTGRVLTRETALEEQVAVFLLGDGITAEDRGGITIYTGQRGSVTFRANGSFVASGDLAALNAEALCRDFCRTFSLGEPVFQTDSDGSRTAAAVCRNQGLPVYNCAVTFTLDQGVLTGVSGTLLPTGGTLSAEETQPLSAAAALTAFQTARRESGAAVSAVTDISLCYELQRTTSTPMSLAPAWRIVTDTANYYVNALTGAVELG